jgi:hypothetical protein
VYVDFQSGNWCEGITAYMADHLIKEQRGQGEEYRRSVLQKYSSYLGEEKDFPLVDFISRTDGISESVGYGKSLMMWHMLRRLVGDEKFTESFQLFYKDYRYKTASYQDIRICFEEVTGEDLKPFFDQWLTRTGAPILAIDDASWDGSNGDYKLTLVLKQNQVEEVYNINVPVHVITADGLEVSTLSMTKREEAYELSLSSKPLKLQVDPQYDLFRILDQDEVPPTLTKMWSSNKNLVLLPAGASKNQLALYEELARQWKAADNDEFEIKLDKDIPKLPEDQSVWVLGYENKYAEWISQGASQVASIFFGDSIVLDGKSFPRQNNSITFTAFDPDVPGRQHIFIACDNAAAIPGLVRKLPHYGKYSYLAFSGDEPTNIHKGQWPVYNSPMVQLFDDNIATVPVIESRQALATLPVLFSSEKIMDDVKFLASEELKGRGIGTEEIDRAAEYIAGKFAAAGLIPAGDSYYQKFQHTFKEKGILELTNVIGIIPGTDPELKDYPVVLSAHYDHLGLGWPDVHPGDEGKIHFGADDNASGVATMLELARVMAPDAKPRRTIVFMACTAEETGLIGSKYFVEHAKEQYQWTPYANVNIDTDGSLFDKKLLVLNANSAREWKFIFMGTDYTTGISSQVVEKDLDASDQVAFIEKGIPGVQLFTGPTENYHRPGDTWDKLDPEGMVKVAIVAKEVIGYLANRAEPLTVQTNSTPNVDPVVKTEGSRKVSTGAMPDFAYQGEGVKVGSVREGSAGDQGGLKVGDVIVGLDGTQITGLKQYSELLKKYSPGDQVVLEVLRADKSIELDLILGSR